MEKQDFNKLLEEIIDRNKWKEIVDHFIDVLKINIILVDFNGEVIVPPTDTRFDWLFFDKVCLGGNLVGEKINILDKFHQTGEYWEFTCISGLQSFAIPIRIEGKAIVYLLVGPVMLNKRENREYYEGKADLLKADVKELWETVNEVRVVSNLTMKSILDLLAQVGLEVVELNIEKKRLAQMRINEEVLPQKVSQVAQELYARIHLDELLVTLLDLALKMTNTECGSIMMVEENEELAIKAARGIAGDKLQSARVKVGEGVAGIAAKENETFIIHGVSGESRIKKYLTRPEIKSAIVMPLSSQNKVFGVLNLHTKKEDAIVDGLDNLQYLSRLIVAAFQSI